MQKSGKEATRSLYQRFAQRCRNIGNGAECQIGETGSPAGDHGIVLAHSTGKIPLCHVLFFEDGIDSGDDVGRQLHLGYHFFEYSRDLIFEPFLLIAHISYISNVKP